MYLYREFHVLPMATEKLSLTLRRDNHGTWRATFPKWFAQRAKNILNIPEDRREIPLMVEVEL